LVSLCGDLQIRSPSGKWGEPIGFGVDTNSVSKDLPWHTQVEESAKAALADLQALKGSVDFVAIARESFPGLVAEVDDANEVIFFGWWFESRS
jgi:hypothetical protein